MNDLKSKLIEFGLSDKEANVYLAMLELGPSSVQDIAKKAGVNRATTYVMIEMLKRRGLMSSVDRGKKTFFAAESPEHLLGIVSEEMRVIEEKKKRLENLMPQFMGLFNSIEHKPKVRFFEGEEGIRACREAQIEMAQVGQVVRTFLHYDKDIVEVAKIDQEKRIKLSSGPYHGRGLYSIDPGVEMPLFGKNVEMRRVPDSIPSFRGELNVYQTFILIGTTKPLPMGVIIESEELAGLCRSLFDLAWMAAGPKELKQ